MLLLLACNTIGGAPMLAPTHFTSVEPLSSVGSGAPSTEEPGTYDPVTLPVTVTDDEDDTDPNEVQQQVQTMNQQAQQQGSQLDAIERYLSDRAAAREGRAPKGWVQPDFSEYAKPDAPQTFLPAPPAPPARP